MRLFCLFNRTLYEIEPGLHVDSDTSFLPNHRKIKSRRMVYEQSPGNDPVLVHLSAHDLRVAPRLPSTKKKKSTYGNMLL